VVVVVGDLVADVTIATAERPVPGEEVEGAIRLQGGGSAANQAAWLAHLGARVRFGGRVGNDVLGSFLTTDLEARGVECVITVDETRPTGIVAALLDADGERALITHRAANAALHTDDVPGSLWNGARLLVLTGYLFTHPHASGAGQALMTDARRRNVPVALDPASYRLIGRYPGRRRFLDWTAGATWFFPNSSEAAALTGAETDRDAAAVLLDVYEGVAITKGARGCTIATRLRGGSNVREIPAPKRVAPMDSTGAGDAFAAGFLFTWLCGTSVERAAEAGLRTAALAVQQIGARPRM
jgi:sugar/nucleoside kinase (ribokinase family)